MSSLWISSRRIRRIDVHALQIIHPIGFRAGSCNAKATVYDHDGLAQSSSLACNEEQESLVDAQLRLEGDE